MAYSTSSSAHEAAGRLGTGRLVTKHISVWQLRLWDDEPMGETGMRASHSSGGVPFLWPGSVVSFLVCGVHLTDGLASWMTIYVPRWGRGQRLG